MGANPTVKKLINAGLTHSTDGLLFDFCSREQWKAAITSCQESIDQREIEITFLKNLLKELEEII